MICLLPLPLLQSVAQDSRLCEWSPFLSISRSRVSPRDEARGTVRRDQAGANGPAPKPPVPFDCSMGQLVSVM